MKFLLSVGGIIDHRFGILTTPSHRGVPSGILAGMEWAADNEAFTKDFNSSVYFPWFETMLPYKGKCLFITIPDKIYDAVGTIELFNRWHEYYEDWPLAFVAQDGQEFLDFPSTDKWSALFVGGSTVWKDGRGAVECIHRAQALGKHIHIGRVNFDRRYTHFDRMEGSNEFTCDGTRQRFEGVERTVRAWLGYMDRTRYQIRMPLSGGDNSS